MRVLVTGATGFLGAAVARALVARGDQVRALVRVPEKLSVAGVEPAAGSLAEPAALRRACDRVEVVVHCAARASDSGPRMAFYRDNVEGTILLARAAAAAGCRRLVYTSSISVYGLAPPPVVRETAPVGELGGDYPYAETKLVAERALPAFVELERVILRVGSIYGPGSAQWTVRPARLLASRLGLPLVARGRGLHNYVYLDNAVDAVVLAVAHPAAAGQLFNVTDGVTSYRDFFGYYTAAAMVTTRLRFVSRRQAMAMAMAVEQVARLRGTAPAITRIAVRLLLRRSQVDSARIGALLGHRPRVPLAEGMAACARWLHDQQLL